MAKNPVKSDCTLDEALRRAKQTEEDLPRIIQVNVSDWDNVVLADEVRRLRKVINNAYNDTFN